MNELESDVFVNSILMNELQMLQGMGGEGYPSCESRFGNYRPDSLFRLNEIGRPMISMCTRIP